MKLIDLLEILKKLEKTPDHRYSDVYVQIGDQYVDLTDISFDDSEDDVPLVLHAEQDDDDIN